MTRPLSDEQRRAIFAGRGATSPKGRANDPQGFIEDTPMTGDTPQQGIMYGLPSPQSKADALVAALRETPARRRTLAEFYGKG